MHVCVCVYVFVYFSFAFKANLVLKDEFSSHQCLAGLFAFLGDGMPQQFGCFACAWSQSYNWGANTAAQQLILSLCRG